MDKIKELLNFTDLDATIGLTVWDKDKLLGGFYKVQESIHEFYNVINEDKLTVSAFGNTDPIIIIQYNGKIRSVPAFQLRAFVLNILVHSILKNKKASSLHN